MSWYFSTFSSFFSQSHPSIHRNYHVHDLTALFTLVKDNQIQSHGHNLNLCSNTEMPQKFHTSLDIRRGHTTFHSAQAHTFLTDPNGSPVFDRCKRNFLWLAVPVYCGFPRTTACLTYSSMTQSLVFKSACHLHRMYTNHTGGNLVGERFATVYIQISWTD